VQECALNGRAKVKAARDATYIRIEGFSSTARLARWAVTRFQCGIVEQSPSCSKRCHDGSADVRLSAG